jgi:diguanylate cyclase (GGDEF)-like protein
MKILVVEDDELTAQALVTVLAAQYYAVEVATDGRSGLDLLDSFEYDLLILDVGLPDLDGIEVCRQVRKTHADSEKAQLPILLLTAHDSHHDRALGLDAGADDYVVKPFNDEELVARIRALLRRSGAGAIPMLEWGNLQLNPSACEVTYSAIPIAFTPKEYGLLELFLRNSRRVFSCANILEHLWAYEDVPGEEAVRTHIKGLRQKLKAAGAPANLVETVYGIGYRLRPLVSEHPSDRNNSPEQELRSKLSAIWHRCKERVSEQIATIEQLACQLDGANQPFAAQQAHTLAGSLGTFGFADGSHLSKEIEKILAENPLKPKALHRLQELTANLRRSINLPVTSISPEYSLVISKDVEPAKIQLLILAISKDLHWLKTIEQELPLWNYHLASASTPKAISKICENDQPRIVILDLECFESLETSMTLLSGLDLLHPPIPAIAIAGHDELNEKLEVSRHGGRLLLQKSTPVAKVLEAITQEIRKVLPVQAKILVVDDDVTLLEGLVTLLQPWGLNVLALSDPNKFWQTLESFAPDVLILDVELPNVSGIELCKVVRSDPRWHNLPVVVMTAHTERATIAKVFEAGADDFVNKPIVAAELVTRIHNRLERVRLLKQFLETDPLTGTANRQKSTQQLEAFLQSAAPSARPVAIAVIEIDHLHHINVEYGHATGDAVLRQVGYLLRQSFSQEDVVARWGGGEFVIGMYGMTRNDGIQRLVKVSELLSQQILKTTGGQELQLTFCSGVAQYPDDGHSLQELYRAADDTLTQAKRLREQTNFNHAISSILPTETSV